jgi:ribokinase
MRIFFNVDMFRGKAMETMKKASAKRIVLIGSINMDLVCRVPRMPVLGETILGADFLTIPGGKGANQAVAAAKLVKPGTDVHLIGRVGDDGFGQRLMNGLGLHGVNTGHVTVTEGTNSGIAMILVDASGENSIIVAAGAGNKLTPADIDAAEELIASASVVVMQLEIPLLTVRHALQMCRRHHVFTILDPAPAPEEGLPVELMDVDLLTPNQTEAEILLSSVQPGGIKKRAKLEDAKQICSDLLVMGARQVVLKMGARGAMIADREFHSVPGFKIKVSDTTAAGDAFTAGLAVAKAEGLSGIAAVRFANAAGALACTGFGAQPSLPSRHAVDELFGTLT